MMGQSMESSYISQVARFLHGHDIVDNDSNPVLYSILDQLIGNQCR